MLLYCLKYKEKTDSKNPKVVQAKNGFMKLFSLQ